MKNRIPNAEIDDRNWQMLFNTQFENLQKDGRISKLWINGLSKLGIDQPKVPQTSDLNAILAKYTGWELIQTNDTVIHSPKEWNQLTASKKMPVTNFVRTPEELFYCDEPDKWHDIIGHVPFLLDEKYTAMYQNISNLYLEADAKGTKYADDVYNIISAIIEVGLIREGGIVKALGATLYSSSGELESALAEGNSEKFDLQNVLARGYYDRSDIQKKYFIVESLEHINATIDEYRSAYLAQDVNRQR